MASLSLVKGARVDLSKEAPGLANLTLGLGWDANAYNGPAYDLDVSVFELKAGKLPSNAYVVFFNQKSDPEGAVVHGGDNRTGAGDGDDETVNIALAKINPEVDEISLIVNIYDAATLKQNFGSVTNSYVRLVDQDTGVELAKYSLEDEFSTETAVHFGSLIKKDGRWIFKAVGQGHVAGLDKFIADFGG